MNVFTANANYYFGERKNDFSIHTSLDAGGTTPSLIIPQNPELANPSIVSPSGANKMEYSEAVQPVENLIEQKIVKAPHYDGGLVSVHMPLWIKNTVGFLKNNQISNDDFIREIQFMTDNGIIKISIR